MKPEAKYSRDDIVTLAEARASLVEKFLTRDAFHKAIKRGNLKKMPNQTDDAVQIQWGDVLNYLKQHGSKKTVKGDKSNPSVVAPSELDKEASPAFTALS